MLSVPKTPLRKQPRQQRSQDAVDAILEAAERLFVRDGYAATTTTAIGQLAGVGIGSVYDYFASKDEMLSALARRCILETAELYEAALAALAHLPLADVVPRLWRTIAARTAEKHPLRRVLIEHLPPTAGQHDPEIQERYQRGVACWLRPNLAGVAIADLEARSAALVHAINGILDAAARDPENRLADAAYVAALEPTLVALVESAIGTSLKPSTA